MSAGLTRSLLTCCGPLTSGGDASGLQLELFLSCSLGGQAFRWSPQGQGSLEGLLCLEWR